MVCERCDHVDLAGVLGHATQPGFLATELVVDNSEQVLDFGAGLCLLQVKTVPAKTASIR